MKVLSKVFSSSLLLALALVLAAPGARASSFQDVWSVVQDGSYATAPSYRVTFASLFDFGSNLLAASADRTLNDDDDVLPPFQKLVHPIGICFAGTWSVTGASPYTGYFAKGSEALIIVRASEALGNPDQGSWRAFGFAGKIFPTTDKGADSGRTANFFTVDDLGGTDAQSFLDEPKTNEPKTSLHASQLLIFPTITEIAKTFATADSNPGIRQVYDIAELGLPAGAEAVTPHWLMIAADTTERVHASDFRTELRLSNYSDGLAFGIYVGEDDGNGFTRIGTIKLTEDALSDGCDHRLHFHHPRAR